MNAHRLSRCDRKTSTLVPLFAAPNKPVARFCLAAQDGTHDGTAANQMIAAAFRAGLVEASTGMKVYVGAVAPSRRRC